MGLMKQLRWNIILASLVFIALGVILVIWPSATMRTICYILAALLIAIGIVSLISYIKKDANGAIYRYDLVIGFSGVLGGILVIIKVQQISALIPVILGFIVTISGVMKIQNSIDMMRMGQGMWRVAFALAIVNIVFGIVLLINPFAMEDILIICIGGALVYSGLTDLYVTIAISVRLKNMKTVIVERKEE